MFHQNKEKGSFSGLVLDEKMQISSSFSLLSDNVVDVSTSEKSVPQQKFVLSKLLSKNVGDVSITEKSVLQQKFVLSKVNVECKTMTFNKKIHSCDICGKLFDKPSNVLRHQRSVHPVYFHRKDKIMKTKISSGSGSLPVTCHLCMQSFSNVENYDGHVRLVHSNISPFKCAVCFANFPKQDLIMKHFKISHSDILIKTEKLNFKSSSEFSVWKENIEKTSVSFYRKKKDYKKSNSHIEIFVCHRSGIFTSRSTGKRRIKLLGTNKSGFYCPAQIVKETHFKPINGIVVTVEFISNHMGHQMEVGRLYLSKSEKSKIAEQLYNGVSPRNILCSISEKASPSKHLSCSTPQDIRNVSVSYVVNSNICSKDDGLSIDSCVREMMANQSSLDSIQNSLEEIEPVVVNEDKNSFEVEIIADSLEKGKESEKTFRQEAKDAILGFLSYVDKLNSEKTCKEILQDIAILRNKYQAIENSEKHLLPAVELNTPNKNITHQKQFSPQNK